MSEVKIKKDWTANELSAAVKARDEGYEALKYIRDVCMKYNACFQVEQFDYISKPEIYFETPTYSINLGHFFDSDLLTDKIKGVVNG